MVDLSSTLFFKGKFEIAAKQEDYDLLWCVVRHIRDWMCDKWSQRGERITRQNADWTRWKFGSSLASEEDLVRFYSVYDQDDRTGQISWACAINENFPSQDRCAPRSWTTEVGFQSIGTDRAALSVVLRYGDRPGYIGPCEEPVPPSIPNLIRHLCADEELSCTVDSHRLTLEAELLKPGDFPAFWEVVSDEKREIPVVYISPRKLDGDEDEGPVNLIDPRELAHNILGPNALVYYAEDTDFSWEMRLCQPDYGCYGGSIRVYAPHPRVRERDDQYRHRYIPSRDIQEMGPKQTREILRRALAQDVYFYDQMFRVEDCKRLKERRALARRMEEYRNSLKESLENEVMESALEGQNVLEQRCKKLEMELLEEQILRESDQEETERTVKDLRQQLRESQKQEETQRQAADQARENALQELRPRFEKYPAEPRRIAEAVMALYPDRIDFTDQGWRSLERQCKGKDPAVLWKVLQAMASTLYDIYEENSGGAIDKDFNRQCEGLSMAFSEGRATHQDKKLMQLREDRYHGESIKVEPHIKTTESKEESKSFLRAYYCPYWEEETPKAGERQKPRKHLRIVIGSIGDHFTTAGTRRMS